MVSVAIITGATGNALLSHAVDSVNAQTTKARLEHWIVVDGAEREHAVLKLLGKMPVVETRVQRRVLVLPINTGGDGFVCHRINGSVPWVCDTDYVCFLDEDNMFDPGHIDGLLQSLHDDARWAHSLRNIVHADGTFACQDMCESLGGICHTVLHPNDRLIDTNCYLLERHLAIQLSPEWDVRAREEGRLEADRAMCRRLLTEYPVHGVSRRCSVQYRVASRGNSVRADFFIKGNARLGHGVGTYDFINKANAFVFHFDPCVTARYVHGPREKDPLDEWCMTLWKGFETEYNLLDGFMNIEHIPDGSLCLVAMCHPGTLPLEVFKKRKDNLHIILYTAESPNIRHAAQWSRAFLAEHFTGVATFWEPLIARPPDGVRVVTVPHNSRFLDFPGDDGVFRENEGVGKSIGMVLERRSNCGEYTIDETTLHALDSLREFYIQGLKNVRVHGNNWSTFCLRHPSVSLGHSGPRSHDLTRSVDHLKKYTFAVIIENCDAEGYVSEKIGDAFIAGTIPIYYGTPSPNIPLPPGTHIDLRQFKDGFALQQYIDGLSDDDIAEFRTAIHDCRAAFLQRRGYRVVYEAVKKLVQST